MAEKKITDAGVTPAEHTKTTDAVIDHAADEATAPATTNVAEPSVPDDVEVAARSADMKVPSTEHRKAFVLGPNTADNTTNPYTEAAGYDHDANKTAVRQYMISAGMWPTGDVRHVSTKRHPDGASWVLTYAVDAVPAHRFGEGVTHPEVAGRVDVDEDGTLADAEKPVNADPAEVDDTEPAA